MMIRIRNTYFFSLVFITSGILFFTACTKDNFDESDPNVYKWEIVYYRYPMMPNSTTGAPEYDFGKRMVEYKREILSLTNKEVNSLKNTAKKSKMLRIEIKKI